MRGRRRDVKVDWLQLPADLPEARAGALADLLHAATGRKVSEGDALLMVVRLWQWALVKVDPEATDLDAEFSRCATLSPFGAAAQVARACRWPEKMGLELLEALQHPEVGVLVREGDALRIDRLATRYANLAAKQQDARGRAQATKAAKRHGWASADGGAWVHPPSGARAKDWRELLARLRKPHDGKVVALKAASAAGDDDGRP